MRRNYASEKLLAKKLFHKNNFLNLPMLFFHFRKMFKYYCKENRSVSITSKTGILIILRFNSLNVNSKYINFLLHTILLHILRKCSIYLILAIHMKKILRSELNCLIMKGNTIFVGRYQAYHFTFLFHLLKINNSKTSRFLNLHKKNVDVKSTCELSGLMED